MTDKDRVTRWGVVLVALGASLWAVDAPIRKPLTNELPATAIVLCEHLFLALYALPVVWMARRVFAQLSRRGWLALLAIGWGGSGLATVLFTEAFKIGNPTTVILLQKLQPLITVALAGLLLRERLPRLYWPCFAVAFVGAYLVSFGTFEPFWQLPRDRLLTAALAIGAAALWGAATVFGRYLLTIADLDFPTLTAGRFLSALPFLAVLAVLDGAFVPAIRTGLGHEPLRLFFLALVPGLAGMLIYYAGLSRTRASYATLAELAYPAAAVIVNWIFLGAHINGTQFIGFVILWLAITALTGIPAPRPAEAEPRAAAS
jgi:drug/metabolite transporter (DMT)-like permease